MPAKKKWKQKTVLSLALEVATKEEIEKTGRTLTEWINEAIKEKLKREEK